MLGQRRRCWTSIEITSGQHLVFSSQSVFSNILSHYAIRSSFLSFICNYHVERGLQFICTKGNVSCRAQRGIASCGPARTPGESLAKHCFVIPAVGPTLTRTFPTSPVVFFAAWEAAFSSIGVYHAVRIDISVGGEHSTNAGSFLDQRRRQWANNEPALGECLKFVGEVETDVLDIIHAEIEFPELCVIFLWKVVL